MNKEHVAEVLEVIKLMKPHKIEMNTWGSSGPNAIDDCGTAGCIGGWTEAVAHLNGARNLSEVYLELDSQEANDLFYMDLASRHCDRDGQQAEYYSKLKEAFVSIGVELVDTHRASGLAIMDELEPEHRKAIVVAVLQTLHDTGEVRWAEAITKTPRPLPITKPVARAE